MASFCSSGSIFRICCSALMASDSSWTNSSRGVVNGIVKILPLGTSIYLGTNSSHVVRTHDPCHRQGRCDVRRHQGEGSGLRHQDATSKACGAACFIRVRSHSSCVVVCFSHEVTVSNSALSRAPWAACPTTVQEISTSLAMR